MNHLLVRSSNIVSVGWESGPAPWIGTMEVLFYTGALYRYFGVPGLVAFRVVVGEHKGSVGSTFHQLIRKDTYAFIRVW